MSTENRDPLPTPISDAPWPKRTNKACCNCRRDKIKCDGQRPCAACLRRGLGVDKCIDGCPSCRRSRARCDGADPCARCLQLGIDCSDEPASPSTSMDDSTTKSAGGSSRSTPAARAKLACLACRRDNKKCDDHRPCMRCISRMEECIHVDRTPKAVKHRCVNCRKENKKCEDARPCSHCVEMKLECTDAPRKGSGNTRVKMACANCRRNKVQCDAERPCRVCVRRGLECFMPSCACVEQDLEPGTCSFCRSQIMKRNSQTMTDSTISQASDEIPSPVSASQSHPFPSDIHMGADTYSRDPYMQTYPTELTASANSFEYHTGLATNEELRQDISAYYHQQQAHLEFTTTTGDSTFRSLGMTDTTDGVGSDKYLSRGLGISTHAYPKDPSVPTSFMSQYLQQHPSPGTSFNSQSGYVVSAPSEYQNDHGVGVGIGAYGTDGLTATTATAGMVYGLDDPTPSYSPVPMTMPVSVIVPVRQTVHSRVRRSWFLSSELINCVGANDGPHLLLRHRGRRPRSITAPYSKLRAMKSQGR